jgi:transcriptional regulator with XRE-family HTH domain
LETHEIYELIEARRKELNLSQSQLGQLALGQDNSSVIQAIKRGSSPSALKLEAICNALGLEFYVGPARPLQSKISELNSSVPKPNVDDFAFVQRFDVKLSAGPGANGDNSRPLASVAFRKEWLAQQGLIADRCVVCGVTGDSMEPLLFDTDLVLIDRRATELRNGQVYAVTDVVGDVRIKRLEKIEGGIVLHSDNPNSPTEVRMGDDANHVNIIGRLAWSGHTHDNAAVPRVAKSRKK